MHFPFCLLSAFSLLIGIVCSCGFIANSETNDNTLWVGALHTDHADIPFRFLRYDSGLVIINSEEQITLNLTAAKKDTLIYSFPHYHKSSLIVHNSSASNIAGVWDSGRRGRKH